jgi:glycosyltransferase involved in cell wall biosynthesis
MQELNRIVLLGPIAQPGRPARGGYESANLRLLNVLQELVPETRALSYPDTSTSTIAKIWQYTAGFSVLLAKLLLRSGKQSAVHFTPHCRHFLAIELLLASAARARGNRLTVDLRAGIQKLRYDGSSALYRWMFRRLLSLATAITFEGEIYGPWLDGLAPSIPCLWLPNFVPEAMLHERAGETLPDSPRLVYVGAVSREKGIDAALKAFQLLRQRLPETSLTLIGQCAPDYRAKLGLLGLLGEGVDLTGPLPPSEVEARLDRSHFFIYLTHWFGEGHSNALTEAMARGCVPIASDHGFNRSVIGNSDLLAMAPDEAEAAAKALEAIWRGGRWRELSHAMVARVAERFTDRQAREVLAALYCTRHAPLLPARRDETPARTSRD